MYRKIDDKCPLRAPAQIFQRYSCACTHASFGPKALIALRSSMAPCAFCTWTLSYNIVRLIYFARTRRYALAFIREHAYNILITNTEERTLESGLKVFFFRVTIRTFTPLLFCSTQPVVANNTSSNSYVHVSQIGPASRSESNQGGVVDKLSGWPLIGGRRDLCGEPIVTRTIPPDRTPTRDRALRKQRPRTY